MTEFKYRKHLSKMKMIYPIFVLIAIVIFIAGIIMNDSFLMIIAGVIVVEFVFGYKLFSRMVSSSLAINQEGVIYKNNKTDILIRFQEIDRIDTRSISSLGGYFVIVKDKKTKIRVAVTLENIGEFVVLLREKLTELQLQHLYNEEKLFKFYKTAVYADGSWKRMYHIFPKVIYYTIAVWIYITGLTMVSILVPSIFGPAGLLFISGILILGTIVYMIDEIANYSKRIKHETNRETWEVITFDPVREKKFINKVIDISFIGMSATFAIFVGLSFIYRIM